MKTVSAFLFAILFTSNSWASPSCAQLKEELKAMQAAQKHVMASLVSNHETFASSLEEYSTLVKASQGSDIKTVSVKMNESAQAFRDRGVQGKKTAVKLNSATEDLLARVAACLK
ncbi:MAG: hypothetical protein HUU57_02365 [Bdellovibrio sp.]|nr:hypothetical protein [Bdellovibrio sp.]